MQHMLNTFSADLMDLLTQDARLSDLLHTGYQVLGNPLMLFNHRGEVLSISEHEPYNDPDWEEAEGSCYYAREKFSQITSYDFTKGNPMLLKKKSSPYRSMSALLPGTSSKIYLSMLESQRPFSNSDNNLLLVLANAIAIKLRKRKRSDTLWIDTHELFISNLLQGKITDENIAKGYAENFSIRPKNDITMITARAVIDLGENDILKFSAKLADIFSGCKTSIYKGDLIILVFDSKLVERNSESILKAREFFKHYHLQACVGIPAAQFLTLANQYQHTAATLNFCAKLEIRDSIIYYEQYIMHNILHDFQTCDLEILCHPGVINLFEIDKEKGTQHILTLFAYTLMHGNHSDAAKLLNISFNTLKYRLKCMDKQLGTSWRSLLPTLYISIKVLYIIYPSAMKECEHLEQISAGIRR